ncbi:hypothetical protein [Streptosporangium minutum]|uniref:Uncharacterized protein n=1 Tax=Streptosporangium minutum TaxID=569862 RepID=A0A243RTR1_9ACTN|nr:hypothetical protein [Streptosporangium minutum]OUC98438.1 hypothetical protein CA984_07300 [Streptosporangium minutum]
MASAPDDPEQSGTDHLRQVHDAAAELAWTAEEIRRICARTTATLAAAATRSPWFPAGIHWSLLRALTNREGLGYAFEGGWFGARAARLGALAGRSSLATLVAVTSLRLRIAGVLHRNPELAADPVIRRLLDAAGADRDVEAVQAGRALCGEKGATGAIGGIAPVFGEVLAMRAPLDENPFNDQTGWSAATGRGPSFNDQTGWSAATGGGPSRPGRDVVGPAVSPASAAPRRSRRLLLAGGLAGLVAAVAVTAWRRRARRASRGWRG